MQKISFVQTLGLLGIASLSLGLQACSTSTQAVSSANVDSRPAANSAVAKSPPDMATAPILNLDLSVDAAYAAIPHRRTAMDFLATNMPDQDRRFLEVSFHVIDQAIRLRVTAYQKFSRGEFDDSGLIAEMDQLVDYLQQTEAPASLATYQAQVLRALSDQRAFFADWQSKGQQFQYGTPQTIATHPKVQSSSAALQQAYGILMQTYPSEVGNNKDAFFDYHCALDFL